MILGRRISIDEDAILEKSRAEANKAKFLREALEKEKEYNSLQREFISMVSHEFRTPLTIIDGSAQRLKRRKETITPDELEKRSDKIRVAVDGMVMLMEKLLYSGRLDEGKIEFSPQAHDLKAIIASSCDHQAEISLNYDFCMDLDGLPPTICADISLLNQVFQNLLSNAVKYSQNSRLIEVKGWTEGDLAMVSVTDHGVGIPEDEQPKLFKRFFRASTSEGIAGTGLGLSLCKSFVTMHGGDIEVDSIEGAGTTFIVKLPIGGVANEKMTA
jgi:signal transduction histidine kinase